MRDGTLHVLRREGFPPPDGDRVRLLMKDDLALGDDAWKEVAAARVERIGPVAAAFDNEPAHVNLYARRWPGALVVHLDTNHSARPIEVLPGIPASPTSGPRSASATPWGPPQREARDRIVHAPVEVAVIVDVQSKLHRDRPAAGEAPPAQPGGPGSPRGPATTACSRTSGAPPRRLTDPERLASSSAPESRSGAP